ATVDVRLQRVEDIVADQRKLVIGVINIGAPGMKIDQVRGDGISRGGIRARADVIQQMGWTMVQRIDTLDRERAGPVTNRHGLEADAVAVDAGFASAGPGNAARRIGEKAYRGKGIPGIVTVLAGMELILPRGGVAVWQDDAVQLSPGQGVDPVFVTLRRREPNGIGFHTGVADGLEAERQQIT